MGTSASNLSNGSESISGNKREEPFPDRFRDQTSQGSLGGPDAHWLQASLRATSAPTELLTCAQIKQSIDTDIRKTGKDNVESELPSDSFQTRLTTGFKKKSFASN